MQTIDKQRLIEWVEKNKIGPFKDVINYNDLLSFIEQETSVLQEGDYFIARSPQIAEEAFRIEGGPLSHKTCGKMAFRKGGVVFYNAVADVLMYNPISMSNKTKLSPSEFLRRARNTFKNK